MEKLEGRSLSTESESGFSEYSSNVPSPMEPTGTSGPTTNLLQSFLQTWTVGEEDLAANGTVTLQVNGEELKCTALRIISEEDAAQLLLLSIGTPAAAIDNAAAMPSMPSIVDIEMPRDRESQDVCQNWIQQHHRGENDLTALPPTDDFSSEVSAKDTTDKPTKIVNNLPLQVHHCAQNKQVASMKISMKDRLQPKLPCHAPQKSPDPSSWSASPRARIGVTPVKGWVPLDVLTRDLELSSSSEDSSDLEDKIPKRRTPLMDPNEVVNLDGMKLRINLRLIRKEEAELKSRPRQISESSSTSCSMEEEDLPLRDDRLSEVSVCSSSSSSSPAAKRHKSSSTDDKTDKSSLGVRVRGNGKKVNWLPYRKPPPVTQEEFVQREVQGMREYDTWLEQRRLLYSRYIPEKVKEMPTNMQPWVVLKRSRAIDELALRLAKPQIPTKALSENNSSLDPVNSSSASCASSVQLASLEELTGGPAGAGEPTLESLLDDLDDLSFGSCSNSENCVLEQTVNNEIQLPCDVSSKNVFVDHFLNDKNFVMDDVPNVEAQIQQSVQISCKGSNLSCAGLVQDGPKKTEIVEPIHVPCAAASTTSKVVEEAAAVKTPPAATKALEKLVLQVVSAVNSKENDTEPPIVTEIKSNLPQKKLPPKPYQTAIISSQLCSNDSSDEDDTIRLYVSDEEEFFNV